MPEPVVIRNEAGMRFELRDGPEGEVLGFADYRPGGGSVVIAHVEVARAHEGKGLAGRLMAGLLEQLRAEGTTVLPMCPYADAYIRRHPEHAADVDPSLRARYAGDGG